MSSVLPQEKKWGLTQEAFDRLLSCLDADRERAGEQYLKIRNKLVSYFECRDCPFPEEHADETINRVARKLESGEEIREPATYVYGVARLLLLEILTALRIRACRSRAALEKCVNICAAKKS